MEEFSCHLNNAIQVHFPRSTLEKTFTFIFVVFMMISVVFFFSNRVTLITSNDAIVFHPYIVHLVKQWTKNYREYVWTKNVLNRVEIWEQMNRWACNCHHLYSVARILRSVEKKKKEIYGYNTCSIECVCVHVLSFNWMAAWAVI